MFTSRYSHGLHSASTSCVRLDLEGDGHHLYSVLYSLLVVLSFLTTMSTKDSSEEAPKVQCFRGYNSGENPRTCDSCANRVGMMTDSCLYATL